MDLDYGSILCLREYLRCAGARLPTQQNAHSGLLAQILPPGIHHRLPLWRFSELAWEEAGFPDAEDAPGTANAQDAASTTNAEKTPRAANAQNAPKTTYTQKASRTKKAQDAEETSDARDACIGSGRPFSSFASSSLLYFDARHDCISFHQQGVSLSILSYHPVE